MYQPPRGGLQLLIRDNRGDRSFARLAADCGFTSSSADRHMNKLAMNPISTFPDPATIAGLARGLKVSILEVIHASAVSVGLPVSPDPTRDLIIQGAGKLSPESRTLVTGTAHRLAALEAA